jgi:hypothetical protein
VAYVYFRDPTPEEATAAVDREAEAAAKAAARREARDVIATVNAAFDAAAETPARLTEFPTGEIVLDERPDLRISGGGTRWVLSPDGALWRLTGNGADGDDWSRNNLPSTVAQRVSGPVVADLAERLRRAATALPVAR